MEKIKINFIAEDFIDYNFGDPWNCPLAKAIKRQLSIPDPCVLTRHIKTGGIISPISKFIFSDDLWNELIATNLKKLSEMNNSVLYSLELEKL